MTGRKDHAREQAAVVRVLVAHRFEKLVELVWLVFDSIGQVYIAVRAGIAGTTRVAQNAFAHRVEGGFLIFGVDRGVDIKADRTHVVEGKSVSVSVDLGGRRIIKKKK